MCLNLQNASTVFLSTPVILFLSGRQERFERLVTVLWKVSIATMKIPEQHNLMKVR